MSTKNTNKNMMNKNNTDTSSSYETYYYCGEHADGYDRYGAFNVYHYISKTSLNGRDIKQLGKWDYDLEIWPGDKLWSSADLKQDIVLELEMD